MSVSKSSLSNAVKTHSFTEKIHQTLQTEFGEAASAVFARSELLQYLNIKTRSGSAGSKSRGSFANLYALYVLAEDYLNGGFDESGKYSEYSGAKFINLLKRQRELPFGSKLQNHALNHRLNEEFKKYFPTSEFTPILRDAATNRFWLNEYLFKVEVNNIMYILAVAVVKIIDAYIEAKKDAFESFIEDCRMINEVHLHSPVKAREFVAGLVRPNVDARIFEIVSFEILKASYREQIINWGWSLKSLNEERLALYKTGRTNANDGGIDFVMRPVGRFFQVTETTDVRKYFLDIDKIQRFPVTFVIKTLQTVDVILDRIKAQAEALYKVNAIVQRYMSCIEEVINIPTLLTKYDQVVEQGGLKQVVEELVAQSRLEFNFQIDDEAPTLEEQSEQ